MNDNNQSIIELRTALTTARAAVARAAEQRPERSAGEMLKLRTVAYWAWVALATRTEVRE
jgi:hypothetical protein